MTYTISLAAAASQLVDIVHGLRQNDTVVLVENDVPVAEIIPKKTPLLVSKDIAVDWLHLSNQVRAMPHIDEIPEKDIRAEIDAYRLLRATAILLTLRMYNIVQTVTQTASGNYISKVITTEKDLFCKALCRSFDHYHYSLHTC